MRYAVYSYHWDLESSELSTISTLSAAIEKLEEFKGHEIRFMAALAEQYSLLTVFAPGSECVTFIVVDVTHVGSVVTKFHWKPFNNEEDLVNSVDYILPMTRYPWKMFTVTVSCQGLYAVILGPSIGNNINDDDIDIKFNPEISLLHCHTWDVEVCAWKIAFHQHDDQLKKRLVKVIVQWKLT